jgi:tetratricopeptide (TPR) repeat protein
MFTPKTRILIIVACLMLAFYSFYQHKMYAAVVAICFVLMVGLGYFRQGTVYLAFKQLRSGDIKKAEVSLAQTSNLKWLSKIQKGYYYFVKGYLETANKNTKGAKEAYENALKVGLRMSNDTAIVYANLATLYLQENKKTRAQEYIDKSKSLKKVKENVKLELERVEKLIQA